MAVAPPDSIEEIFTVEREIAAMLDGERLKSIRWLDETRNAIDQAAQAELVRLEESAAQDEAAAKASAAENAAAIVERAKSFAARIDRLDDAHLTAIVRKQIAAIVPGPSHDR